MGTYRYAAPEYLATGIWMLLVERNLKHTLSMGWVCQWPSEDVLAYFSRHMLKILEKVRNHCTKDRVSGGWALNAVKQAPESTKKKEKNVSKDPIEGKIGKVHMPDQKIRYITEFCEKNDFTKG